VYKYFSGAGKVFLNIYQAFPALIYTYLAPEKPEKRRSIYIHPIQSMSDKARPI